VRHTDVEEHGIGSFPPYRAHHGAGIGDELGVMPEATQKKGEALRCVGAVVYDDDLSRSRLQKSLAMSVMLPLRKLRAENLTAS
jgi:hypothetical protein